MKQSNVNDESEPSLAYKFVAEELARCSAISVHKENITYSGFALFVGACSVLLLSKDWPPVYLAKLDNVEVYMASIFTAFSVTIYIFLRHQLRGRRWAALRVSGCNWFLAKYVRDAYLKNESVVAMEHTPRKKLTGIKKLIDLIVPLDESVEAFKKELTVYPEFLKREWEEAEHRGTVALTNERIVIIATVVSYVLVMVRILTFSNA